MKQPLPARWMHAAGVVLLVAMYGGASALLGQGYWLAVFANLVQLALLSFAVAGTGRAFARATGRERLFWALLSFAALLWWTSQLPWVWHEVIVRAPVPEMTFFDFILFFHAAPVIAALFLRPQGRSSERVALQVESLDVLFLLLVWSFIYAYMVLALQQGSALHLDLSGHNYSLFYFMANMLTAAWAGYLWATTKGAWRGTYRRLSLSACCYCGCSYLVKFKVLGMGYYSGSLYDLPLVASIALFGLSALGQPAHSTEAAQQPRRAGDIHPWIGVGARMGFAALPLLAAWTLYYSALPAAVVRFRVLLVLMAIPLSAFIILWKQQLLDRELKMALDRAEEALRSQREMQAHVVQSEKLAGVGRLVAGVAHEINNPVTAIAGYGGMLAANDAGAQRSAELGGKIQFLAQRIGRLIEGMMAFSTQSPARLAPLDVHGVLRNVAAVREKGLQARNVRMECVLAPGAAMVNADSNHLLQLFVYLVNHAVDSLEQRGGTVRIFSTLAKGQLQVSISHDGKPMLDPDRVFEPFYNALPADGSSLGLGACYAIAREHHGDILCVNRPQGGTEFVITLPLCEVKAASAG